MRKINYSEPKINDLLEVLKDLGYATEKLKDSIDIPNADRNDKKKISHELSKLNGEYRALPLAMSFNETDRIVSIFDQRG